MSNAAQQLNREIEIVRAAERTFSRFGYRRASMEGIAEEAGLSRAGLYTYFSRKEELFGAVVRWLHEQSLEGAGEVAERDGLAIEARLVGMFEARVGFFIDRYRDLDQAQELFTESSRQCADVLNDSKRRYRLLLTRVLSRGRSRGCASAEREWSVGSRGGGPDRARCGRTQGVRLRAAQPKDVSRSTGRFGRRPRAGDGRALGRTGLWGP